MTARVFQAVDTARVIQLTECSSMRTFDRIHELLAALAIELLGRFIYAKQIAEIRARD